MNRRTLTKSRHLTCVAGNYLSLGPSGRRRGNYSSELSGESELPFGRRQTVQRAGGLPRRSSPGPAGPLTCRRRKVGTHDALPSRRRFCVFWESAGPIAPSYNGPVMQNIAGDLQRAGGVVSGAVHDVASGAGDANPEVTKFLKGPGVNENTTIRGALQGAGEGFILGGPTGMIWGAAYGAGGVNEKATIRDTLEGAGKGAAIGFVTGGPPGRCPELYPGASRDSAKAYLTRTKPSSRRRIQAGSFQAGLNRAPSFVWDIKQPSRLPQALLSAILRPLPFWALISTGLTY